MLCPTCSLKLRTIGTGQANRPVNYCDRCGTVRIGTQHSDLIIPAIVDRARALIGQMDSFVPDVDSLPDVRALREAATGRPDR